jgi:hypothetical protein
LGQTGTGVLSDPWPLSVPPFFGNIVNNNVVLRIYKSAGTFQNVVFMIYKSAKTFQNVGFLIYKSARTLIYISCTPLFERF